MGPFPKLFSFHSAGVWLGAWRPAGRRCSPYYRLITNAVHGNAQLLTAFGTDQLPLNDDASRFCSYQRCVKPPSLYRGNKNGNRVIPGLHELWVPYWIHQPSKSSAHRLPYPWFRRSSIPWGTGGLPAGRSRAEGPGSEARGERSAGTSITSNFMISQFRTNFPSSRFDLSSMHVLWCPCISFVTAV